MKALWRSGAVAAVILCALTAPLPTRAAEHRPDYCEPCARDQRGKIQRSATAKQLFRAQSGFIAGRPGYHIDHVIPLACGGADAPENMQWLVIAEKREKDKTERHECVRTLVANGDRNIWDVMPGAVRDGFAFGFLQALVQAAPPVEHSDVRLVEDAKLNYLFGLCATQLSSHQMQLLISTYISEHPLKAKRQGLGTLAMAAMTPFCKDMPIPR